MVGKIPYDVYSELFDVGVDCIQKAYELGKSKLETQIEKMKSCRSCKHDNHCNHRVCDKNLPFWELRR